MGHLGTEAGPGTAGAGMAVDRGAAEALARALLLDDGYFGCAAACGDGGAPYALGATATQLRAAARETGLTADPAVAAWVAAAEAAACRVDVDAGCAGGLRLRGG